MSIKLSPHVLTAATHLYQGFSISTGPLDDGDTLEAYQRRQIEARAKVVQDAIAATLRDLFLTMPAPPDDMGAIDGLEAYAECIAEWRARNGYALSYDGPSADPLTLDELRDRAEEINCVIHDDGHGSYALEDSNGKTVAGLSLAEVSERLGAIE